VIVYVRNYHNMQTHRFRFCLEGANALPKQNRIFKRIFLSDFQLLKTKKKIKTFIITEILQQTQCTFLLEQ